MNFVTSDIHFSHSNIIKYCNRPFKNSFEMDDYIISIWNKTINVNDNVYILGDFMFSRNIENIEKYVNRLNGYKILVLGNHDNFTIDEYKLCGFNEVYEGFIKRNIHNRQWIMCHYQMAHWDGSHKGSFHLFGHEHWKQQFEPKHSLYKELYLSEKKFNVCMDANNFTPVNFIDIIKILDKRNINNHYEDLNK
jgi:calcineurin-like phosphoesterase family protein